MPEFDDGLLDDPQALQDADGLLRPLAEAGARLRRESDAARDALALVTPDARPRAVVAVGPEARLLRAVLEPTCPVPFVAWPNLGLPGWVGPLDVVVVLGGAGRTPSATVSEALRRGSRLIVTAPEDSPLARQASSRATTLLPSRTSDPLCGAITTLMALHALQLAGPADPAAIADAMDEVATRCSLSRDIAGNPAKKNALELADGQPLIWGGSVLAARASRRIAEAVRGATGRVALSADAGALIPILAETRPRDPFEDPFEEQPVDRRPVLVVIEDGLGDEASDESREILQSNADAADVHVVTIEHTAASTMERYATVLQEGLFSAAYLAIGGGRVRALANR
ncbi:hypothetical protein [Nigerium sp.]|jgi:hypothetical protein|uniref:hypothetical protein n=1 Tax=Nigerium sp. TaxID=2042655 RepID=UPI003221476C